MRLTRRCANVAHATLTRARHMSPTDASWAPGPEEGTLFCGPPTSILPVSEAMANALSPGASEVSFKVLRPIEQAAPDTARSNASERSAIARLEEAEAQKKVRRMATSSGGALATCSGTA